MANTFRLKRSAVSGKVPTTGDLQLGELAINTYDGKLYTKKDNGTASVVEIGGGSSSGNTYTMASTPPASPSTGDRWLDSDTGIEYTYISDGTSSQWAETNGTTLYGSTGAPVVADYGLITASITSSADFGALV